MIYQVKQGTKVHDYIKHVLDMEYAEYKSYMERIDEAVGFKVERYKAHIPNASMTREYKITEILIPIETYNELDKKIWREVGKTSIEEGDYMSVKPNKRTKQGKLIGKAMESYNPVASQFQIMKELNLDFPNTHSFHLTQLFRHDGNIFVYLDDNTDIGKDNSDLNEITESELNKIMQIENEYRYN